MSSLLEPKLLLHRKLSSTWSSAELAAYLESKPSFLSDISNVFRTLDHAIKLRVLLAFRALDSEEIAALPQEMLLSVLDEAGGDQDEWVKVCACMVRDALFGSSTGMTGPGSRPPAAEVTMDVFNKCGVLAEGIDDEKEEEANEAIAAAAAAAVAGGSPAARARRRRCRVEPEPYFCPIEYLYLSEALIQRHHRQAPLTRKQNAHFVVGDLKDVEMEPIPDSSLMPSPSLPSSLPSSLPAPHSSSSSSSSSSSLLKAELKQPPPPSPRPNLLPRRPSSSSSSSSFSAPSSLLSQHHHQNTKKDKPRLKIIKLDEIKTGGGNQAKIAARNEAVSQEFGSTQPLRFPIPKKTHQQQQQRTPPSPPPPPPPSSSSSSSPSSSLAESQELRKRNAAEALAGLLSPPPSSLPPAGAAGAAAPITDALADYYRMKAKSNRLTPQDDERIRSFYLHGAREGGKEGKDEQQKVVKIKINEEEQVKEDGSRVKESLYLTLNYDSKKAVLSRKVSRAKEGGKVGGVGGVGGEGGGGMVSS